MLGPEFDLISVRIKIERRRGRKEIYGYLEHGRGKFKLTKWLNLISKPRAGVLELSRLTATYIQEGEGQSQSRTERLQYEVTALPFGTKLGMKAIMILVNQ